eukprot:m.170913 g.170913  ORF g.170913 m.170913 type:complete len:602 (+) comp13308_c0_seq1:272-2077(+)
MSARARRLGLRPPPLAEGHHVVPHRSPSLAFIATHIEDEFRPLSERTPLIEEAETVEEGAFESDEGAVVDGAIHDAVAVETGGDGATGGADNEPTWLDVSCMVGLFVVLGASGWWSNNTINNENPVFVEHTPEGNRLPALGSFACQIGNVFPIVYKSITGFCLSEDARRSIIAPTVYVGLLSGALILAVCAFFWKNTIVIGGQEYSGVLLLGCVISGGIGCMSNVTYWAFASRYPVYCTKAMSTGMTFGGLLGSAIILGQNAGCDPYFSTQTYFLVGVVIQLVMLVGTLPILKFQEEEHTNAMAASAARVRAASQSLKEDVVSESAPLLPKPTSKSCINDTEYDPRDRSDSDESGIAYRPVKQRAQPSYINRDGFILCCLCFLVYGMTYALAPMMPYVLKGYEGTHLQTNKSAGVYPNNMTHVHHTLYTEPGGLTDVSMVFSHSAGGQNQHNGTSSKDKCNASSSSDHDGLYRWAIVCQQVGDVSGRISTAFGTPTQLSSLLGLGGAATAIFLLFCVATGMSDQVPLWLPGNSAYVIPSLLLIYYFLRGFCVTSSYVWVKLNMPQRDAERLSSNLGMLGQFGALFGNILMVLLTYSVLEAP